MFLTTNTCDGKGECIKQEGECHTSTEKTCEECIDENIMTSSGVCKQIEKCEHPFNNGTQTECLICESEFENVNGICQNGSVCEFYEDGDKYPLLYSNIYNNYLKWQNDIRK